MAETVLDRVPPAPVGPIDSAVAVRASNEDGDSACLVLGNELVLRVVDVRTEQPLLRGAYIRSCTISADGDSTEYRCPDKHRHPRSARHVESYSDDNGAQAWQKGKFYAYVGSSLKRLGWYTGEGWPSSYGALKDIIPKYYKSKLDYSPVELDINEVVADLDGIIEEDLGGRDHVPTDGSGVIRLALPDFVESGSVKVRLEFHDIKFLTNEDMDTVSAMAPGIPPGEIRPSMTGGRVVYDRASATWPTSTTDPDHPDHESDHEFSNWYLHCGPPPVHPISSSPEHMVRFRNFVEFSIPVDPEGGTSVERTVYAMTWASPVWHDAKSFRRKGLKNNEHNFVGPPIDRPMSAINTTLSGSGTNYGIMGIFRRNTESGRTYYRLHIGNDLGGNSRDSAARPRTPVFAVAGGRRETGVPQLRHADEAITGYVHIESADRFLGANAWAKAGTVIGRMGRYKIPASYPTHVHFDARTYVTSGWTPSSSSANLQELPDGANKLSQAGYPHNPGIHTPRTDGHPQYIKWQYGEYTRDPGTLIKRWMADQLGPGGWVRYREEMPGNFSHMLPPCQSEYVNTSSSYPSGCTASCRGPDGASVADQTKFAQSCWAVRSSRSPSCCVCPGLSDRGAAESFTDAQRVQYHLWQLGHYDGKFDSDFGQGSRNAVENALAELGSDSPFNQAVAAKEEELSAKPNPLKEALKTLLGPSSNLNQDYFGQLLQELETICTGRFGA